MALGTKPITTQESQQLNIKNNGELMYQYLELFVLPVPVFYCVNSSHSIYNVLSCPQ